VHNRKRKRRTHTINKYDHNINIAFLTGRNKMTKIAKMIEEETDKMIFVTYRKPDEPRDYEDEALWYVAMAQAEGYRDLNLKGLAGCIKDGISPLTAEDVEEYYKECMEEDRGEFDNEEILRQEIRGFYQPHAKPAS